MYFKKLSLLLILGSCLLTSANAVSFSDVDVDGQNGEPDWVYMKSSKHSPPVWTSTFDLLSDGFDPLTMKIVGATVSFAFADDGDRKDERVGISVGGTSLWNFLEVNGSHAHAPDSYDWYSMNLGAELLGSLSDGVLEYEVIAQKGDFYLKEASLVAEIETLGHSRVPDVGTTVVMLGLGVTSLVVLRKQMKSGNAA